MPALFLTYTLYFTLSSRSGISPLDRAPICLIDLFDKSNPEIRYRQAPLSSGRPPLAFICYAVGNSITNSSRSGLCLAHSCPLFSRQAAVSFGSAVPQRPTAFKQASGRFVASTPSSFAVAHSSGVRLAMLASFHS